MLDFCGVGVRSSWKFSFHFSKPNKASHNQKGILSFRLFFSKFAKISLETQCKPILRGTIKSSPMVRHLNLISSARDQPTFKFIRIYSIHTHSKYRNSIMYPVTSSTASKSKTHPLDRMRLYIAIRRVNPLSQRILLTSLILLPLRVRKRNTVVDPLILQNQVGW